MACSFGDISTTSFFPAKPLGCYGDGGALFTNNKELYDLIVSYRVHGKGTEKYDNVRIGMNSRLDTIQAAILHAKLDAFIEHELDSRQVFAKMYTDKLKDYVATPLIEDGYISSYAQYTLILDSQEQRDFLKNYLANNGVPSMVYYPKPLHCQKAYKDYDFNFDDLEVSERLSKCVLSLPMHPYLNGEQINDISNLVIKGLEEYKNE
jgi:dTDP-4-amino-4,6-dideoxygalactose transaminase